MDNGMALGGSFMWIFWILLVVVIVVVAKALSGGSPSAGSPASEAPLEILRKRYARGEIDEAEFERRRNELGQ
ncbi:MAG TPA: SHOCT domain-containing protein [Gammaproteobacteria bacterium]|nr:SHOCT domain-containing protein [Gammaproteobacteria bacterium]